MQRRFVQPFRCLLHARLRTAETQAQIKEENGCVPLRIQKTNIFLTGKDVLLILIIKRGEHRAVPAVGGFHRPGSIGRPLAKTACRQPWNPKTAATERGISDCTQFDNWGQLTWILELPLHPNW